MYYAKADGSFIKELVHEPDLLTPLNQPNGVGLSPDGKRLYVSETATGRLWGWSVVAPGELGQLELLPGRENGILAYAANGAGLLYDAGDYSLFDSLAVDSEGNICLGTLQNSGITVVRPEGGKRDFIAMPEYDFFTTNICFGGPDLRTA
ncbi:SMP-30/gluconolactonase/LRE family protein (plasmid) [Sphingobium sp. JS3065]|nr:SMP-30/gluconolactonase/LRE family protein [Sphingobium sp. JS3065]